MLLRYKIIKIIFIILCFSHSLYADIGNKKVKLVGEINSNAPQYITAQQLDEQFKTLKFTVYNPWEKQEDSYEGIFLDQLAKHYAKDSIEKIVIKAIDDYTITFEKELYMNERILLAYKVNGEFISVRDKGPMRIIFVDYDSSKKKYELNLAKWLWMIKTIDFK